MKSTSILLLLVALMLPTRSEAFLAEIFSFIIGIFIPDWQVRTMMAHLVCVSPERSFSLGTTL